MKSTAFELARVVKAVVRAARTMVRAMAKMAKAAMAMAKMRAKAAMAMAKMRAKATFCAVLLCQSSSVRFLAMHHDREYTKITATPIIIAHNSHGTNSMSPVIVPAAEMHHPAKFAAAGDVAPIYPQ